MIRIAHVAPGFPADGICTREVCRLASGVALPQTVLTAGATQGRSTHAGLDVLTLCDDNPSANPLAAIPGGLWAALAGFDVVHVHEALSGFGAYAAVVVKSLGKKLVLTDHGGGGHTLMTTGRGLALADVVLATSEHRRALLAAAVSGPHVVAEGDGLRDLYLRLAG